MTYKEYCSKTRKVKADQLSIDKTFISEYQHRNLFGRVVNVTYRFRGKVITEKAFFEGLKSFFHDIIPIFRVVNKKGKGSKVPLGNLYSLNQIIEMKEENQ